MGRRVAGRDRWARPWWRPLAYSAATFAAIGLLFQPLPAAAAPGVPAPVAPAVPDTGSRPAPLGTLLMPGQPAPGQQIPGQATGAGGLTVPATLPGTLMTPLLQKIEKQRNQIAALGDKLIRLGQDREIARQQATTTGQKVTDAQVASLTAQQNAEAAAAAALRDQAAMPPGTFGSGLADLDSLSRLQRGDSITREAADRQLAMAKAALTAAMSAQATATTSVTDLSGEYDSLNAEIAKKQTALQKDERKHQDELSAAEAAQSAEDRRLGERYLDGTDQGRGAHPNAISALKIALAQIGDPYVWSEEGPDEFDCSGLMQYAYTRATGSFNLARVSRDQYKQTSQNLVDRYSLVPGDLLFFSSSNSWTGIHHVAMYAGEGKMVEAPRTGLNVRLTPVRWSRLFGATRIWGSVDHPTDSPDLDDLPPKEPNPTRPSASPSPSRTTKPPTIPDPDPSPTKSTKPPGGGSPSPSGSESSSSSPSPSTSKSSSSAPPPPPPPPPNSGSNPPSGDDSQSPEVNSRSPSDTPSKPAAQSNPASESAGANPQ